MDFSYFFVRKVMLIKYASAYIIMPGEFGTLDEMFEEAAQRPSGPTIPDRRFPGHPAFSGHQKLRHPGDHSMMAPS